MKYLDIVELIKERPEYTKEGVKKGDFGVIMIEEKLGNKWYVIFSEFYTAKDIAGISVREEDLKVWDKIPEEKTPKKPEGFTIKNHRCFGNNGENEKKDPSNINT